MVPLPLGGPGPLSWFPPPTALGRDVGRLSPSSAAKVQRETRRATQPNPGPHLSKKGRPPPLRKSRVPPRSGGETYPVQHPSVGRTARSSQPCAEPLSGCSRCSDICLLTPPCPLRSLLPLDGGSRSAKLRPYLRTRSLAPIPEELTRPRSQILRRCSPFGQHGNADVFVCIKYTCIYLTAMVVTIVMIYL